MDIVLEQVCYERQGTILLESISTTFQRGSLTTLLGPNGAGKTTLLKLILGLLSPSKGVIHVPPSCRMGYMPQKMDLTPLLPLTVQRFLSLTPNAHVQPKAMLERVGALPLQNKPLFYLSGGELQRVLLAKAFMRNPHVLILDEPTQGLDVQGQTHFYELLLSLRDQEACTILMVSHDLHTVLESSDHVICLNRHICCEGTPDNVQQAPAYLNLFPEGSLPPKRGFYAHHHDHTHV